MALGPDPMRRRDLVGYGEFPPDPRWPGGARIAVNFNLNVEGGGESTLDNGDPVSEGMLNDIGVPTFAGRRVPLVESVFEYGSRRGVWRVLDIFRDFDVPVSVLGVVRALEQHPALVRACLDRGHEIVSHGYRWIDYGAVDEAEERAHIRRAIELLRALTGEAPLGWMTGRPGPNTRRLICEAGGFLYDRDSLADELPYWVDMPGGAHLVIPYSYEANDNRFNENSGFSTAGQFFEYMRDAFDTLYLEGERGAPKLLSIGLHDRLIGRPGRAPGLVRLLEHMRQREGVWFCRGVDIARHWHATFSPEEARG
ncbi:polysaccharide deacetylase family protein [Roseococcus suduntuyensis]|uniref:Chitooligosaccharide deacetylase n=1 Tax=Roseococcus suduntuyensis TaxID=455361 RepID=A0A840AGD5_9PROT|nr:polysaccharide deacetylase family protein [Roseococcus suduntuyensis]MBB3899234.1 peptidoglycan/xylan/chitin deacetylase (PgdA/CDA1 family) [Roseococcus suduntuyensis]